jgi:hypothetical protein
MCVEAADAALASLSAMLAALVGRSFGPLPSALAGVLAMVLNCREGAVDGRQALRLRMPPHPGPEKTCWCCGSIVSCSASEPEPSSSIKSSVPVLIALRGRRTRGFVLDAGRRRAALLGCRGLCASNSSPSSSSTNASASSSDASSSDAARSSSAGAMPGSVFA